jgi:hypothetical protein
VSTYEEWRVTGTWLSGDPYSYTWTHVAHDAEGQARTQVAYLRTQLFNDGPYLHKRTVTVTDWTEVDA